MVQVDWDVVAIAVSLLALGVSVWAVVASSRVGRAQVAQQERLLAIETARDEAAVRDRRTAKVWARVMVDGRNRRLEIRNDGEGGATDIRLLVDGAPFEAHDLAVRGGGDIVRRLGAGATASYLLGVVMSSPDMISVEITWMDASGETSTWASDVKVF